MDISQCLIKPLSASMLMTLCITLALAFMSNIVEGTLGTLILIAVSGAVYFVGLYVLKVFSRSELSFLPIKQK